MEPASSALDLGPGGFSEALRGIATERLRSFDRHAEPLGDRRAAAVALVLVPDLERRPCFVLTRRASRLNRHAGQWALPGGRVDEGEDSVRAALRELVEEISLDLAAESVLGLLDDYPTRSGYVITPVVVWGDARELSPNPKEVASVHRVPLAELERPDVPRFHRIPESDRPVISIPMLGTHVHAPTAALVFQLREVVVRGQATRVAHFEQPVFAWR
jgi:8-oxo-dGTP pyrophosphatase MutT (NUDIX family)